MWEFDEYVRVLCDFLERLPPQMVIHRLSGDSPRTTWSRRNGAWTSRACCKPFKPSCFDGIAGKAKTSEVGKLKIRNPKSETTFGFRISDFGFPAYQPLKMRAWQINSPGTSNRPFACGRLVWTDVTGL